MVNAGVNGGDSGNPRRSHNPRIPQASASWLAEASRTIGPEAKEAVPALIAALKDQDAGVRWEAATALGEIGLEAKEAVPALIAALKDQNELVRWYAARALKTIKPETEHLLSA
jgi:HEAT repeat protein